MKSKLSRHDDGLNYQDIGLEVSDIKQILRRVRDEVSKTQEGDADQVYDKKVLEAYVKEMDHARVRSLSEFFDLFTHEKFGNLMKMKIHDLIRSFELPKEFASKVDWHKISHYITEIVSNLGEDIAELPVEELYRFVKNITDEWKKDQDERKAMKAFDPGI